MMNKTLVSLFFYFGMFILLTTATAAQNISDVNNLVEQNKLSISVTIAQDEQQIVGQALIISIEVATDRWFATGSQVQNFTLPNVVMQANNIITINGSKRIKGKTWATQTHEITLYPTLAGSYNLPALNVDVSINTENNGIVGGVLSTQETNFTIVLPEELNGIDNFIVSPEVTLTIDGQFDTDKNYAIGEAITQTITITASDIPAMMIPELNIFPGDGKSNMSESALDGISIYRKPAQVFDKSNRGSLLGSRVESFTYIFEEAGSYVLPEQIIYWWNSQSNTLEALVIPTSSWTVSGGGLTNISESNFSMSDIKLNLPTLLMIVVSLFTLLLTYLLLRKHQYLIALYKKVSKYEQRQLRQHFFNCIAKQEYLKATQYLYQYLHTLDKPVELQSGPLTEKLNKLAFQAAPHQNTTLNFSVNDAKALIEQIDSRASKIEKHLDFSVNEAIKLNDKY